MRGPAIILGREGTYFVGDGERPETGMQGIQQAKAVYADPDLAGKGTAARQFQRRRLLVVLNDKTWAVNVNGELLRYGVSEGSLCGKGYADEPMETHIGVGDTTHRERGAGAGTGIDGSPRPDSLVVGPSPLVANVTRRQRQDCMGKIAPRSIGLWETGQQEGRRRHNPVHWRVNETVPTASPSDSNEPLITFPLKVPEI